MTPLLETTFTADGWRAILGTGNGGWGEAWGPALAAGEIAHGTATLRICQVKLAGRTASNPVARLFTEKLFFE